jgi:hypothetical protein
MERDAKRFVRMFSMLVFALAIVYAMSGNNANAATIFESGTLGQTGIAWSDLENQTVQGTNVNSAVFIGVRFELSQPVVTTQVGGHFASGSPGAFFGAIVKLDDANDFPDSTNLSTPDVLGKTTLTFPNPSTEVFGNLNLSLNPGWYALVFGSGLFGTTGLGGTVENGVDIGTPTYLSWQFGNSGWSVPINPIFRNYRFVVQGALVPEPSAIANAVLAPLLFLIIRRRKYPN